MIPILPPKANYHKYAMTGILAAWLVGAVAALVQSEWLVDLALINLGFGVFFFYLHRTEKMEAKK